MGYSIKSPAVSNLSYEDLWINGAQRIGNKSEGLHAICIL
jgi:hypothetical protein